MCYTCGCKEPFNNHGDQRNITESDFADAGKTPTIGRAGKLKAKQNMIELLNLEKKSGELSEPKKQY